MFTVLAIRDNEIPPTLNLESVSKELEEGLGERVVLFGENHAIEQHLRFKALSNSWIWRHERTLSCLRPTPMMMRRKMFNIIIK